MNQHDAYCIKRHNDLVDLVTQRLERSNTNVASYVDYKFGELDVVKCDEDGVIVALYEIKGYDSLKGYNKMHKQLKRAWEYFGHNVDCIYVSQNAFGNIVAQRVFKNESNQQNYRRQNNK